MSTITLPEPSVGVPPGPSIPLAPPLAPVPPTGARAAAASAAPPRSWLRGLVRGREADPAWVRPGIVGLLAATALLYLWGLGASGWANSFYSAAVQAGSQSWKAFFFGSSDAANFITVDKPPVSLWLMALSVRVFGLSSWSILVPEALAGVASVGVLYAAVRRWFSPGAGLLAGAVLALIPAAALMFRFNNPDALLVLLLTIGAYGMVRALESGATRWLALASAMVGFGFLTKMLQALLVVPAFGLVYLVAGPPKLGRRLWQLVLSAGVLLVSAGWWVAIVELLPASMRPYIGGSQNNSVLNLIFGYNGFGRLTGNETGSVGGGGQAGSMWGPTGWLRLFNSEFGGQASWLLPAALIFLAGGLLLTLRAKRTDRTRASLILWGGWLVVTGAAFSLGQGIIHPYYTVALAPAIGALVGIGAWLGWTRRSHLTGRAMLAAAIAATAWWSYELLDRTPTWLPWLRGAVLWFGFVAAVAMLFVHRARALVAAGVVTVALAAGLGGTAAYALATASQPHTGAIPSVGPSGVGGFGGGPGGGRFGGGQGGFPGGQNRAQTGTNGQGTFTGGGPGGNRAPGGGNAGGAGGLLNGSTPSAELVATLDANASKYTWVAATIGANQASGYQLSTGDPVMAIGGFNGTDPWPTLAQFQQYVAEGRIHYFIAGGGFGGGQGGSGTSSQTSSWVSQHFTATTVGGVTLYDLTSSPSS